MREFVNSLKVAALFIGTVIGAGFATGRELCLYFADSGIITLAFSASLMGAFCFVFLYLGRKAAKSSALINKSITIITSVSSFFVYSAMLAATEELIRVYFGLPLAALFLGILSALLCNSLEALKKVNIILIPMLIAAVIIIAAFSTTFRLDLRFRPVNALGYCTMNMLFASALMRESGQNMRVKYMAVSSAMVAIVVFVLMYLMLKSIIIYKDFSMPFLLFSASAGFAYLGFSVILIAIFTTIIGCNKLIAQELNRYFKNRFVTMSSILAAGMLFSLAGFMKLVDITYPIISALGIAVCVYSLVELLILRYSKRYIQNPLTV